MMGTRDFLLLSDTNVYVWVSTCVVTDPPVGKSHMKGCLGEMLYNGCLPPSSNGPVGCWRDALLRTPVQCFFTQLQIDKVDFCIKDDT